MILMRKPVYLALVVLCLCGCSWLPIKFPTSGTPATESSKNVRKIELSTDGKISKDVQETLDKLGIEVGKMADTAGKLKLSMYEKSSQKIVPKRTWWQNFVSWATTWVGIAVLIGIALALSGNGWIIVRAISNARKFSYDLKTSREKETQYYKALKSIIKGVEKSGEIKDGSTLATSLSGTMDEESKVLIRKIKSDVV